MQGRRIGWCGGWSWWSTTCNQLLYSKKVTHLLVGSRRWVIAHYCPPILVDVVEGQLYKRLYPAPAKEKSSELNSVQKKFSDGMVSSGSK
jgi:hypothetical protein